MGLVKAAEKDTYLDTARTFEYDRMRAAIQSKRLAWTIASGACVLAVIATGAVAMLAPLKTVEPYVIRVDRSSGETEILTALKGPQPGPTKTQ
jgi:type IV secretion system protein VirB8